MAAAVLTPAYVMCHMRQLCAIHAFKSFGEAPLVQHAGFLSQHTASIDALGMFVASFA
jgi:hypothetical protein